MNILTKTSFIDFIAKNSKIAKTEAEKSLNLIIENIQESLSQGNKLTLTGFGSFYTTKSKAREGKNPRTGEKIAIKASNQPRFKAGSQLKALCN